MYHSDKYGMFHNNPASGGSFSPRMVGNIGNLNFENMNKSNYLEQTIFRFRLNTYRLAPTESGRHRQEKCLNDTFLGLLRIIDNKLSICTPKRLRLFSCINLIMSSLRPLRYLLIKKSLIITLTI